MNPKKVEYNEADTNMTYAASVLKANSGHPDYTNDIREEMQDKYPETIASFKLGFLGLYISLILSSRPLDAISFWFFFN